MSSSRQFRTCALCVFDISFVNIRFALNVLMEILVYFGRMSLDMAVFVSLSAIQPRYSV